MAALRRDTPIETLSDWSGIDAFFLAKLANLVDAERALLRAQALTPRLVRRAKRLGFSDRQIGLLVDELPDRVRDQRRGWGIRPTYKMVDTCAAEFAAVTPYFYGTYETENEAEPLPSPKVVVIGSGPIRIGQGIEFDYCSVRAAAALRDQGVGSIMINSNPETVSTDFDASSRLYFEPRRRGVGPRRARQRGRRVPCSPSSADRRRSTWPNRWSAPVYALLGSGLRSHRRRRRPRSLRRSARPPGHPAAAGRHRGRPRGRRPACRSARLSGPGATVVRPRRAGHGDLPQRGRAARLRRRGQGRVRARSRCSSTSTSKASSSRWTPSATARTCWCRASCSTSSVPASTRATASPSTRRRI